MRPKPLIATRTVMIFSPMENRGERPGAGRRGQPFFGAGFTVFGPESQGERGYRGGSFLWLFGVRHWSQGTRAKGRGVHRPAGRAAERRAAPTHSLQVRNGL